MVDSPPPGKAYRSADITVYFDASRCRHFAECVRGLPGVFDTAARPWIQPDNAATDEVAEVVRRCPTGALHYQLADAPGEQGDPVTVITALPGGPLLLRGNLSIVTQPGEAGLAETRMAACSCGRTANQPFCDGACHPAD
ncbi:MAG TPA: (4Fe-4S)-binding protein [Pseudonocardiaceae bacterium]|jgi:uncharacterized Fe-S cluster protein YjdI|nr:(4Fe-4S)-binding protein [Pseudonocardiaceae bacterium]